MGEATEDRWASWLVRRRHGEDPEMLRRALETDDTSSKGFIAPGNSS